MDRQNMQLDDKKSIFGWSLYDWANSAFVTSVMTVFFPIFFKQFWCVDVDTTVSTARLGLANSISGIIVALSAQILKTFDIQKTFRLDIVLIFFSALAMIIVFYKESFRRRTKAFINRNFKKS